MLHVAAGALRVRDVMVASIGSDVAAGLGDPVDADALVADTDLLASGDPARPAVRAGAVVGYVIPDDVRRRVDELIERWYRQRRSGGPLSARR